MLNRVCLQVITKLEFIITTISLTMNSCNLKNLKKSTEILTTALQGDVSNCLVNTDIFAHRCQCKQQKLKHLSDLNSLTFL